MLSSFESDWISDFSTIVTNSQEADIVNYKASQVLSSIDFDCAHCSLCEGPSLIVIVSCFVLKRLEAWAANYLCIAFICVLFKNPVWKTLCIILEITEIKVASCGPG